MRRLMILILGATILTTACNDDGGSGNSTTEDRSTLREQGSFTLRDRAGGECDVVGNLFNVGSRSCEGCINFDALNSAGAVIDSSIDCVSNVQPNSGKQFAATFFDVPCSRVARFEESGLTQFCD